MGRKTYYYIIATGLSAIFIYALLCIFILVDKGIPTYNTAKFKNLFALTIVIYETIYSGKILRTINIVVTPFLIIGLLFTIMHWPGGALLFYGSLVTMLLMLFVNAFKSADNRVDKIVILIFPLVHTLLLLAPRFNLMATWWSVDLCVIGVTALYLWTRIARRVQ